MSDARRSSDSSRAAGQGSQVSFNAIVSLSRAEQVRQQLQEAIERGELKPGDALPSERVLSEQFGVGRLSVREGLRGLEALGLVVVRPGSGSFVRDRLSDQFVDPFNRWVSAHQGEILELLMVRGALEQLAAELVCLHGSQDDLKDIRRAHEAFVMEIEGETSDVHRLIALDVAFHDAIASASGSTLLASLLRDLGRYLTESRRITIDPDTDSPRSPDEHGDILAALELSDAERARDRVRAHMDTVHTAVRKYVGEAEDAW